jgi:hypothetical protein
MTGLKAPDGDADRGSDGATYPVEHRATVFALLSLIIHLPTVQTRCILVRDVGGVIVTVAVDEAVDWLTRLSAHDLSVVLERVLERRPRSSATQQLRNLVRLALLEDEEVERLAGPALHVHSSVEDAFDDLRIKVEARRTILSHDMLDAAAVADLMGGGAKNRREVASGLKRRGVVVALPGSGRGFLYPSFQFDPVEKRVRPIVAEVNRHLQALEDPWGVASWWVSSQPRLDGRSPRDVLGSDEEHDLLVLVGIDGPAA